MLAGRRPATILSSSTEGLVSSAFRQLFQAVAQAIRLEPRRGVQGALVGADVAAAARDRNLGLIKEISEEGRDNLRVLFARGTPSVDAIRTATGATKSKAKFWAVDQTLKTQAAIVQERSIAAGFPGFRWHTVQDERVRDEHAELDGRVFRWDDLPPEGAPGTEPRCRCFAEPLTEDEMQ